ncbi:NAD(P)H-binding protein [Lichenihabitans sp. PAMC28606]|uniref:NAD(P)-dependent oxidoreductase n=1 Tax=Lichenihabitans sp. PAMC28606 TaxID=2880932 RepID=UPI001D0B2C13|nr:NAD(P)H-binding protein [Lichenihabitans sp. PAMC28606]UDL95626.1 NAD(P)H-binding protein [Lichenihabitans sp. PAMC28606]
MDIVIFGASGRTGLHLIVQALAMGHRVTAIVRRPDRFGLSFDRLRVMPGDALHENTFDEALVGQDAVISALGVAGITNSLTPMTFHVDTAHNILSGMRRHGINRFVGITSVGVAHEPTTPLWYRVTLQRLLRHKYGDMLRMEAVLAASTLDWTVIRPVRLTNGPLTQHYRTDPTGTITDSKSISRADVADLALRQVSAAAPMSRTIAVSY